MTIEEAAYNATAITFCCFFGPVLAGGCFIYLIQMFEDKKNRYFIFQYCICCAYCFDHSRSNHAYLWYNKFTMVEL